MSEQEYLFPRRLTRRDFLWTAGAAGALAAAPLAWADPADKPVTFGQGKSTYTLDPEWAKLPAGMQGVIISRVDPLSPAFDAEIERGHVLLEINRHPVRSVDDYRRLTGLDPHTIAELVALQAAELPLP